MEPELSGTFWVKMVAKNIVLGSPGIHLMHKRVKSLLGMSLLTYISMPPPFRFWSSRKGEEKPSIRKLDVINISSSFFSVNVNISTWFEIRHFNWSNFPDIESIFRFPIITFFECFSLTYLSSHIWSILFGVLEFMSDNFAFLFKLLFDTIL